MSTAWLAVLLLACLHQGCAGQEGVEGWEDDTETEEALLEELRTSGQELRTGEEEEDGTFMDDSDLRLTRDQRTQLYQGPVARSGLKNQIIVPWTEGVVPYVITPGHFNSTELAAIAEAIAEWEKYVCVDFRPATAQDTHRVRISAGTPCSSNLGMLNGVKEQKITLTRTCIKIRGSVIHEFGHTLGLIHEHKRPDRDSYVRIAKDHLGEGGLHNVLNRYHASNYELYGVKYDYDSIMHYSRRAYSKDGNDTIVVLTPGKENHIGQREQLSFYDVKSVSAMYKCSAKCKNPPRCESPCFVNKHCKCFCKHQMPEVCRNGEVHCRARPQDACCRQKEFSQHCKVSCGRCQKQRRPAPPPTPECKDEFSAQDCHELKTLGICSGMLINKGYRYQCNKTCGQCPPSLWGHRKTPGAAVSKSPSAIIFNNPKVIVINRPSSIIFNTQSAKPAPKPTQCRDKASRRWRCKTRARRGSCSKTHSDFRFMRKNCRFSCGFC